MKAYAVACFKGGVGKTSVVANVAGSLANSNTRRPPRILLVDLDPQGSATRRFTLKHSDDDNNLVVEALSDALTNPRYEAPEDLWDVSETEQGPHVLGVSSSDDLVLLSEQLVRPGGEAALKRVLRNAPFDYAFIDTPPSKGRLALNAIVAADRVFSVITPTAEAVQGAFEASDYLDEAREFGLSNATFVGAVSNRVKPRRNAQTEVIYEIVRKEKLKLLKTEIPERVGVQEAELVGGLVSSKPLMERFAELSREITRR